MVRDSKLRHVINQDGSTDWYSLRRLKCRECNKLHTELPDFMQPYKHHSSEVIEAELDESRDDRPADDSTISRWKTFFRKATQYIEGILISLWTYSNREHYPLINRDSLLETIRSTGSGWLASVTRMLVNSGFYIHTQFAFCPGRNCGTLPSNQ